MDELSRLFSAYDRGTVSRRQLLQALGLAAVSAPLARAFGQGQCAGRAAIRPLPATRPRSRRRSSRLDGRRCCSTTSACRPPTPRSEAAFYAAFMGWKVRSNDGNEIYMDIGDWGGVKIRGGYVPPAAVARVAAAVAPLVTGGRTRRPCRR